MEKIKRGGIKEIEFKKKWAKDINERIIEARIQK